MLKHSADSLVPVRYFDKKRIHEWLNVNRLQLPLRSFNLNPNNSTLNSSENVKENYSLPEIDVEFIGNEAISEKDAQRRPSENDMTETIYNLIKIKKPSQNAIYEVSRQILSKTYSRMSIKQFAERLTALIDYIEDGDADIDSIKRETKELAKVVIACSDYTDDDLYNQYKDVRKQILRKTIYVNTADIGIEDIKQASLIANRRFYITNDESRRGTMIYPKCASLCT